MRSRHAVCHEDMFGLLFFLQPKRLQSRPTKRIHRFYLDLMSFFHLVYPNDACYDLQGHPAPSPEEVDALQFISAFGSFLCQFTWAMPASDVLGKP
jgi:hypothetical protein